MVEIIYYVGVFYLLHLFFRMSFSLHKVPFIEWTYTEGNISGMTALSERLSLASDNLRQTLPIFLVFAVLSIILEVDNLLYAQLWFGFRILYLLGAVFNLYKFKMVRPTVWAPSVILLFMMGTNLVS
tara:strand:+ start:485 stop:865 length:381 start_codon:yes stop_codon:yes gene_type:complete